MQIVVDAGSFATAIIALVGFGVATYRWVLRPMRAWLKHVHEVVDEELTPNGGSSMKDRVGTIERKLSAHVDDAFQHHHEQRDRHRRYDPDPKEQPGAHD